MSKQFVLIVIAVVVIFGGILFFITNNQDSGPGTEVGKMEGNTNTPTTTQTSNTPTTPTTPPAIPTNSVELYPAATGNFARVSSATLTRSGFVVVYQVNSNSDTKVVGTSDFLSAGTHTNLNIQLSTPIVGNQTIVAVLHADSGDGKFTNDSSDPYLGNLNEAIVSDVDVVDVRMEDEDKVLQAQVETYLKNNASTSASSN